MSYGGVKLHNTCVIKVDADIRPFRDLTIQVISSFNQEFINDLRDLESRDRKYDNRGSWWVHPALLETVIDLAKQHFSTAKLIEGETETNLFTGEKFEQRRLF